MNDGEFEKYLERIEELYKIGKLCENPTISIHIVHSKIRKEKLKEILEEIYQKGKDDKFKVGYLDVDEFYPDNEKEAKL